VNLNEIQTTAEFRDEGQSQPCRKKKENRNSWADQKGLANFLARKFCGNFWNAEIRQALAKSYKI